MHRVGIREDEIVLRNQEEAIHLFGKNGELRKFIQSEVPVQIIDRGETVAILGESDDVVVVDTVLREMLDATSEKIGDRFASQPDRPWPAAPRTNRSAPSPHRDDAGRTLP